jgi:hypothetical protein
MAANDDASVVDYVVDPGTVCHELSLAPLAGEAVGGWLLDVRGGDNGLRHAGANKVEYRGKIILDGMQGHVDLILDGNSCCRYVPNPDLCICGQPKQEPVPEGSHYVTPCCRQTVSNCCGDGL